MEVGYCLNREYCNRGFATEGMKAFLDIFWTLPSTFPVFGVLGIWTEEEKKGKRLTDWLRRCIRRIGRVRGFVVSVEG